MVKGLVKKGRGLLQAGFLKIEVRKRICFVAFCDGLISSTVKERNQKMFRVRIHSEKIEKVK